MSISDNNYFYVYVYLDPRKPGKYKYGEYEFDYEPFYVGKGHNERITNHLLECNINKSTNRLKSNKIKKIIKETNQNPVIIKYKENLLEHDALNLEIKMIKNIGRIDIETGPLTNLTDGGEGSSGYIHSEKSKMKIRNSKLGKRLSEEHKRKISLSEKGKTRQAFSEEHKRKISENHVDISNKNNPMFGKKHSDNSKVKMSESKRKNCKYFLSNGDNYFNLSEKERHVIRNKFSKFKTDSVVYKNIEIFKIRSNKY